MEIEQNHNHNGSNYKRTRGSMRGTHVNQEEDEEDAEPKGPELAIVDCANNDRMRSWHLPSSRIYRVSRATGGKDRHSKVYTSKGLRDRRVRLSVSTAIQFYDLQDRLGYDQPSKAIEWLIKAAQSAIDELPSLDTSKFMDLANQQVIDPEPELGYNNNNYYNYNNQQQNSSTSETSKGSVLSLSRSETRVKARERARERVKDKEKDSMDDDTQVDPSLNSQGSFTKLLTGDTNGQASSSASFIQKHMQNLSPVSSTADYFSTQSGFSSQTHFENNSNNSVSPVAMVPLINNGGDQQFAFMQDHFFQGDYNLNFSISPIAGFHRGTLQSNPPHHHHQIAHNHNHHQFLQTNAQRLSLGLDRSSVSMPVHVPFFFGTAANGSSSPSENQYASGFDGHLQHLEIKGKGKG